MKIFKKILLLIIASILLINCIENTAYAIPNLPTQKPIKVGVFLVDLSNAFNFELKNNLEELQKESENKIQFTVFDGKSNQAAQNDDISKGLNSNFDVFVVAPISSNEDEISTILNKIISTKHPLILFFPTTDSLKNLVKTYPGSVIIVGDTEQGGTLEGKILADEWKSQKNILDKNKGDSTKYIPVVGIGGVPEAKKLIDQGFMTGTAVQDSKLHAKAIYDVAVNLASEKDPLYGTDYKFDETGITIKIPYYEYVK